MNFRNSFTIERRSSLQANIVPGMFDRWKKAGRLVGWWVYGQVGRWLSHPTLLPGAQGHGDTTTGQLSLPPCSSYTLLAGRMSRSPAHCTRPEQRGGHHIGLAGRLAQRLPPRPVRPVTRLQLSPLPFSSVVILLCLHPSVTPHSLLVAPHSLALCQTRPSLHPHGSASTMLSPLLIIPLSLTIPGFATPPCFCMCHLLLGVSSPPHRLAKPCSSF